jgi:hypothetical protein
MKKILRSLLAFLCFSGIFHANAQIVIKGTIKDTSANAATRLAVINIISLPDSMLVAFTRTNELGNFTLKLQDTGNYLLQCLHPRYADYIDFISIKSTNETIDKGLIAMTSRSKALDAVIARGRAAIKIKGDTIMYLADSFKVDANANVEDLLKVLPGIQVDKDGKVIAQGEQVQKVLVDGEEFFGDDPTMVTKGLQARTIDKVEVYDDKSEQAKFTGFDDGSREKTINLKMKKDMKRGTFGKVEGHTDFTKFWNTAAMANSFKNSRKLSGYATSSNTGRSGLNWSERSNFGGGNMNNMEMGDDGMMYSWSSSDDDDDDNWGGGRNVINGLPRNNTAGVQYSNKWDEAKHQFNIGGTFKNNLNTRASNSTQTNFLQGVSVQQLNKSESNSDNKTYSGRTKYEWQIDSLTGITLNADGRVTDNKSEGYSDGSNVRNGAQASRTVRNTSSKSDGTSGNVNITVKRKTKVKGRTLSLNTSTNFNNNESSNTQIGNIEIGSIDRAIDQTATNTKKNTTLSAKAIFTEALKNDKLLMEISYQIRNNHNTQLKKTNGLNLNGNRENIDSLSNDFTGDVLTNTAGLKFNWKQKKYSITLGTSAAYANFIQKDLVRSLNYNYNRFNLFPQLVASWRPTQNSNMSFNYNGNTDQPDINQLQNVVGNTDPLNITLGNPNLIQSYSQNFRFNYGNFKTFTGRSLWMGANFSNTFRDINSTQRYDALTGQNINSYANVNGNYNGYVYGSYNVKIPKTDFSVRAGFNGSLGRNVNVVNDAKSFGFNRSVSLTPGLRYNKDRKLAIGIETEFQHTSFSNATLGQINKYWTITPSLDANIFVTKRFVINTEVNHTYQQANTNFAAAFTRTLWDGNAEYRFLAQKNLVTRVTVYDILNQNNGYERNGFGNSISERNFLTIKRMVLFGVVYNFSFGPAKKTFDEDGDFE